jgi:transcriptional regulator with XRE-family HTH domain
MEAGKGLLHQQEATILDNVINKLQIYMDQNKQTLYGLAAKMGFAYQPFYRLMTKKHLPTLNSLTIIASHFDCSVSELIHEDVCIDVDCFDNFADAISKKKAPKVRTYIPYNKFLPIMNSNFFAVKAHVPWHGYEQSGSDHKPADNKYAVFYRVDTISIDGVFLVNYKSKDVLLEVLSVSSKYIIALLNGKETKIDVDSIKPIAHFFSYLTLMKRSQPVVVGVPQ